MTEQEIINILKDNKRNGIAFGFLPDEVIRFALKHKENLKFHDSEGFWIDTECQHKEGYEISIHEIVCLPKDFELKEKMQGEWVEFEIDNEGFFISDKNVKCMWPCWSDFLFDSRHREYTAFGGWQYENSDSWLMTPRLAVISPNVTIYQDNYNSKNYAECECKECKPAIPVKIRFWREA